MDTVACPAEIALKVIVVIKPLPVVIPFGMTPDNSILPSVFEKVGGST
jgi:hypothetical protein